MGEWVSPGAHVNLVGSSFPTTSEADAALVARCRYFVDYRPSALAQAGELKLAMDQGLVTEAHIVGEVGAVLAGRTAGRNTAAEVTVFKSLGNAAEDLAAARHVHDLATAAGLGVSVRL
jgi:ornithine cyclodeaminase